jgi:prepilin peptidase CpaA
MIAILLSSALVGTVLIAAFTDLRTRKIPNLLTVSALGIALGLRASIGGAALLDGLAGLLLGAAIVLPLFAVQAIGGGDAKLLLAVAGFLGLKGFLVALAATAIAGGILAVAISLRRGVVLPVLLDTGGLLRYYLTLGRQGKRATITAPQAVTIPYAVAIALGSVIALYFGATP